MSTKRINWLDHLISLFVVIFGITIAFLLDNNRERTHLNSQERIYTSQLLDDLKYNSTHLDTLNYFNDRVLKAISDLTDATLGISTINDTLLAEYVSMIQYPVIFLPKRAAYESMKFSGQLNLISDLERRNKVTALHEEYFTAVGVYDQYLSEHVRDYIKSYIIDNVIYTSSNTVDNQFLEDEYFQKIIFQYKFSFEARNDFFKEIKLQTDRLISDIERS